MTNAVQMFLDSLKPKVPMAPCFELPFLEALYAGDSSETLVLADWLEDNGQHELANKLREALSSANVQKHFRELMVEEMSNPWWENRRLQHLSRYSAAKRAARVDALKLFPTFYDAKLEKEALDSINAFTRKKMLEEGFHRQICPPVPIDEDLLS